MDFTNKYAIVTGGANGIGRCIVEKFIQLGAYVIFVDIDKEAGSKLCRKISDATLNGIRLMAQWHRYYLWELSQ